MTRARICYRCDGVIIDLPFSRNTILNYGCNNAVSVIDAPRQKLSVQEWFVIMQSLHGRTLCHIGSLFVGLPNGAGVKRRNPVGGARVAQIRNLALAKIHKNLNRQIGLNLDRIESRMIQVRKQTDFWRKVQASL